MADAGLVLGAAAVRAFFRIWLKGGAATEVSDSLTDLIAEKVSDERRQRELRRFFERLEERVGDQVISALSAEFRNLPANEREAAIYAVTLSFSQAKLTAPDLFAADLDPLYLERQVRSGSRRATRDLSDGAAAYYDRVLAQCCSCIVEMSSALPGFEVGAVTEILARETEILKRVGELLDRVSGLSAHGSDSRFENAYRQLVAKQMDHLDLFGVTLSDSVRTYSLSAAYISIGVDSPQIASRSPAIADPSPTGSAPRLPDGGSLPVELALSVTRRMLLRGDAGTGKTTLLQWIAVRSALRDFPGILAAWNDSVPFLIRLRQFAGRKLPAPEEFLDDVGRHISEEMPRGWVQEKLRSGLGVVLVDGIDELPEPDRAGAREWLRALTATFPRARYIVSSRPSAVAESWLGQEYFDPAEIQPMLWRDVEALVRQWHATFRGASADDEQKERVRDAEAHLLDEIRTHPHLRQLATNPLLTALLCALNHDRRAQLPHDRMEIYKVALEMLLERRDTERKIGASPIALSRKEQGALLEDLAYWLLRNGWSDAPVARVEEQLDQRLRYMTNVSAPGTDIVKYLLDRSGLLRNPAVDRIDFIHRTFQEYLAGAAAVDADDIGVLAGNAHDDQWRDVIIMAAGHAHLHQRNELLRRILARAEAEPAHRRALRLLAVACLETCPQLGGEVLDMVGNVAAELLPPRKVADADHLAAAGGFMLDLLAGRPVTGPEQTAATIRLASLIGGEKALDLIAACAPAAASQPEVMDELRRAWFRFDPETYARRLLNGVDIAAVTISDPAYLPALRFPAFDYLRLRFRAGHGDLSHLPRTRPFRSLMISDPALTDITPLTALPALRELEIDAGRAIRLSGLASCEITTMQLTAAAIADISSLLAFPHLTALDINDSITLPKITEILSSGSPLQRLGLRNARNVLGIDEIRDLPRISSLASLLLRNSPILRLDGIQHWAATLTSLSLEAPDVEDIQVLGSLPLLRFLNITQVPVPALDFLAGLPGLQVLHLGSDDQPLPDLSPIRDLPALRQLYLWGSGDADLAALRGMGSTEVTVVNGKARNIFGTRGAGREFTLYTE